MSEAFEPLQVSTMHRAVQSVASNFISRYMVFIASACRIELDTIFFGVSFLLSKVADSSQRRPCCACTLCRCSQLVTNGLWGISHRFVFESNSYIDLCSCHVFSLLKSHKFPSLCSDILPRERVNISLCDREAQIPSLRESEQLKTSVTDLTPLSQHAFHPHSSLVAAAGFRF